MSVIEPAVSQFYEIGWLEETTPYTLENLDLLVRQVGVVFEKPELPVSDIEMESIYGVTGHANPQILLQKNHTNAGKLSWYVQSAQLFHEAWGKTVSAGAGPDGFTNTFSAGTRDARPLRTFTFGAWNTKTASSTIVAADIINRFGGCKIDSFTLSAGENEPLKAEADIKSTVWDAEDVSDTVFPTTVPDVTDVYMFDEGSVIINPLLGASSYAKIKDFSFNVKHNIAAITGIGSNKAIFLVEGKVGYTLSATAYIEDETLFNAGRADPVATTNFDLTFTKSTGAGHSLQLIANDVVPKLKFPLGDGVLESPIDFQFGGTAPYMVSTDDHATYPI